MCSVHGSDGLPKTNWMGDEVWGDGGCVIIRSCVVIRGRGRFLVIRYVVRPEHVYLSTVFCLGRFSRARRPVPFW